MPYTHVYIGKCSSTGKGNIQLPMCKYWLWKVNPNSTKCLSLGLVDGHGVCQSDRKLTSLQYKWQVDIIWCKPYLCDQDALSTLRCRKDLSIYAPIMKSSHHEPSAIANSISDIKVTKKHD